MAGRPQVPVTVPDPGVQGPVPREYLYRWLQHNLRSRDFDHPGAPAPPVMAVDTRLVSARRGGAQVDVFYVDSQLLATHWERHGFAMRHQDVVDALLGARDDEGQPMFYVWRLDNTSLPPVAVALMPYWLLVPMDTMGRIGSARAWPQPTASGAARLTQS